MRIVEIRPSDQEWMRSLWRKEWGAEIVVTRGVVHSCNDVEGLVALEEIHGGEERIGLLTFRCRAPECEIITLNALRPRGGCGTALIGRVKREAEARGCRRLWLITTNDNTDALRFYQTRGFVLAALHRNAIADSRRIKPEIALVGNHGIAIRDEIELEMILSG